MSKTTYAAFFEKLLAAFESSGDIPFLCESHFITFVVRKQKDGFLLSPINDFDLRFANKLVWSAVAAEDPYSKRPARHLAAFHLAVFQANMGLHLRDEALFVSRNSIMYANCDPSLSFKARFPKLGLWRFTPWLSKSGRAQAVHFLNRVRANKEFDTTMSPLGGSAMLAFAQRQGQLIVPPTWQEVFASLPPLTGEVIDFLTLADNQLMSQEAHTFSIEPVMSEDGISLLAHCGLAVTRTSDSSLSVRKRRFTRFTLLDGGLSDVDAMSG